MSNLEIGEAYEIFIEEFLKKKNPEYYIWRWHDIPETYLWDFGYIGNWNEHRLHRRKLKHENNLRDLGIDILMYLPQQKKYQLIQCKNYNSRNVRLEDLGTFFFAIFNYQHPGVVYYSKGLSVHVKEQKPNPMISYVRKSMSHPPLVPPIQRKQRFLLEQPYEHQKRAYDVLKNFHRSILQLPCGMGKTLIGIMVTKNTSQIIIFSPLRAHAKQNLERYQDELARFGYEGLLVCSDVHGTRDICDIRSFIKNNNKIILSFTFDSCDRFLEIQGMLTDYKIIMDEFHNLSLKDVTDSDSSFYSVLHSQADILFMSATPKIYEEESDCYYENTEIFGNIEYSYPMGKAIEEGFICDYDVFVPCISKNNDLSTDLTEIGAEISEEKREFVLQVNFLLRCLYEIGNKKCIVYLNHIEQCYQFKTILEKLNQDYFYGEEMFCETITSETRTRADILERFARFEKGKAFLLSIRILDECIDIPECDSIFVTKPNENKIRNIQRMCRANRKDVKNPSKRTAILLWCLEGYSPCTDFFSHLKEFDERFSFEKIRLCHPNSSDKSAILSHEEEVVDPDYGILKSFIVGVRKVISWDETLERVKSFISQHKRRPSISSKDKDEKTLGKWISHQIQNYKQNSRRLSDPIYRKKWDDFVTEYSEHFISDEEKWDETLKQVKSFISQHKRRPSTSPKDKDEKTLGKWIYQQNQYYKKKSRRLSDPIYRKKWDDFVTEYSEHFISDEEKWDETLNQVKSFISQHKRRPSTSSKDKDEKTLSQWIYQQNQYYKKKCYRLSDPIYRKKWEDFVTEYL